MPLLSTLETLAVSGVHHALTQDEKVSFVRGETQHDQIGICTVDAMARVWVEGGLGSLRADEVQDFVLTLSRDESI